MLTEYPRKRKKGIDFKGMIFKDLRNLIESTIKQMYIIYMFRQPYEK